MNWLGAKVAERGLVKALFLIFVQKGLKLYKQRPFFFYTMKIISTFISQN